jgi:hypothetical protein
LLLLSNLCLLAYSISATAPLVHVDSDILSATESAALHDRQSKVFALDFLHPLDDFAELAN